MHHKKRKKQVENTRIRKYITHSNVLYVMAQSSFILKERRYPIVFLSSKDISENSRICGFINRLEPPNLSASYISEKLKYTRSNDMNRR